MTPHEIAKLAAVCLKNYDNTSASVDDIVQSWSFSLSAVPYAAAAEAIRHHILESPFFPKASDIYTRVLDQTGALPDPGSAWAEVVARISSTYPGQPAPDWDAPYPIRQAVRAMGGIQTLRMSENPMADRAHFMKIIYPEYRQAAIRAVDIAALIEYGAAALEPGFGTLVALPKAANDG